uniref:Domain of unknown function WSN domain-containing protein n=1 Tax=Caenorhabditis japonica TaxID=281687 RepID=A0A8R1DT46_CAEJA
MHDLLRKGGKTFDKKILIGLPNGSRDLAALAQDFKKEWLKQVLHDGESLDELETLLKPMKKFEMQLASIEKVSHKSARNNYLNCIRKFLKSIQGLDALKSTNISQTLPKAIDALENLSSVENYVSQFVVKFDELVNSCYTKFESLESELESFHLKKDDPYFFNKINNISSDYPLDGSKDEQLEHLDHLPYHEYLDDMKFTASSLLYFKQKENNITECIANISIFWKKFEEFRLSIELLFNSNVEDVTNVLRVIKTIVPFTGKERSSIRNVVDFLLAAKAKLSESKKLDADLQQEMKHVDVNRMLSFSNARDIASQFAYYHRTLVFYQKPEFLNFFHYFRSNGLELARKIDGLPYNEKKATGQVWQKMLEGNETEDELTIINFLKSVVVTEKFFSKNYSRPEGNLTSLAKVLIKLNGITVPVYNFMMMRESIEALKITSLGHSEQVSNAERSLAQLEGVHSSLAHTKYKIGNLLEEGDKFFDAFFTEKSHEDWATILLITAVVAYALVFIAVVILCCVYKWEFKIADVKQRK